VITRPESQKPTMSWNKAFEIWNIARWCKIWGYFFFSPGATTPIVGCILQPSSGL